MHPSDPLCYPSHFPPSDRWNRFFIGVRWIGPDLSFFKTLRSTQASRTPDLMDIWGGGERQALAESTSAAIALQCDWPTPYFLPADSFATALGGPSLDSVDATDIMSAIAHIEQDAGVKMGDAFWQSCGRLTVGELVDLLLATKSAAANNSFKPNPLRGSA